MAKLIDSLGDLDHAVRRKFKKVFAQLSDEYIVRTTVHSQNVADLVIEGPQQQWLLLGLHAASPTANELGLYLQLLAQLNERFKVRVNYLAVTQVGPSLFDLDDETALEVTRVEQSVFFDQGCQLITQYLSPMPGAASLWLKAELFPEATVNPACTARKEIRRTSTSAELQQFFLDYDQELASKLDLVGGAWELGESAREDYSVRLINGVAGSGKTLILLNRARLYCEKFPQRNLLLLIHNRPITRDVEYKLSTFLGGKPNTLTVLTFHAFALSQAKLVKGRVVPLFSGAQFKELKAKVLGRDNSLRSKLNLTDEQLWSEIEYINNFLIENEAAYLTFDRQGRGFALQKSQRQSVWVLYQQAMALMNRADAYLPSLYIRELCLSEEVFASKLQQFDHILIDEAQFFNPSWLHLVLRCLKSSGQLFICADPNQGFLEQGLCWKRVGLNVRGRTRKLRYSYRTSYEILVAADALLAAFDEDPEEYVKPDLTHMAHGDKPLVVYSAPQDELKRFLNELKAVVQLEKVPLDQILVLVSEGYNPYKPKTHH